MRIWRATVSVVAVVVAAAMVDTAAQSRFTLQVTPGAGRSATTSTRR